MLLFKDQLFGKKAAQFPIDTNTDQPIQPINPIVLDRQFPLKPSTRFQPLVKKMQQALIAFGGMPKIHIQSSGGADGYFGNGTKKALAAFGTSSASVSKAVYTEILKKGGIS